ncbi:hypothetical protein E1287_07245 [Actinomadura sp. KC06]|uniref:hypothetical protein n=1 Tax=Actinomadura sp. KC06 TaxID=2530369 RepID=UPI001045892E|nr:hypothetical protein [Actinomadura sp. KC06]TDD37845.1 hypothetical protein E1287_07245 [Actinomadura sp. KC06]
MLLLNPEGDRHMAFDPANGQFYRLWQHKAPEQINGGEAILLRPTDIDLVLKQAMTWIMQHPGTDRAYRLGDEIIAGAKTAVVYFAQRAGAV